MAKMIAEQKIAFIFQLVSSAKEVLEALEKAQNEKDHEKFELLKQELLNLIKEIKSSLQELKKIYG